MELEDKTGPGGKKWKLHNTSNWESGIVETTNQMTIDSFKFEMLINTLKVLKLNNIMLNPIFRNQTLRLTNRKKCKKK